MASLVAPSSQVDNGSLIARSIFLVGLHPRLMQRNPRWDVEVSIGWAIRAAGR